MTRSPWPTAIVAVIPAAMLSWGVVAPGGYYDRLVLALWACALLLLVWAAMFVANRRQETPTRRWPFVIVPVVLLAGWAVAATDLPGRAAFALTRSDLDKMADTPEVFGAVPGDPVRLGPYAFWSLYREGNCVILETDDPGMAEVAGFARCPHGPPPNDPTSEKIFEPFDGDWYAYTMPFGLWEDRFERADPWGLRLSDVHRQPSV